MVLGWSGRVLVRLIVDNRIVLWYTLFYAETLLVSNTAINARDVRDCRQLKQIRPSLVIQDLDSHAAKTCEKQPLKASLTPLAHVRMNPTLATGGGSLFWSYSTS